MSLLDIARDTLKDLPISDILRERLSLALDQSAHLDSQNEILRTQNAELKAELGIVTRDHAKTKEELQRCKQEHVEDVRIVVATEFRRGLRTGGVWVAFCPKCHLPASADDDEYQLMCSGKECRWRSDAYWGEIKKIMVSLT
jgi:hypothetical protein